MRTTIIILALLLSGCGNGTTANVEQPPPQKAIRVQVSGDEKWVPERFSATSYGRFNGGGMYDSRPREIFIIKDNETGVEYLAITGCGTSQLVARGKILEEE